MDELDNRLIKIVTERGSTTITEFLQILSRDYYAEYSRHMVKSHAESCVKLRIFSKTTQKAPVQGRACYVYTLRE